jgi:thiol-disulfide isomerase/thioredoxin
MTYAKLPGLLLAGALSALVVGAHPQTGSAQEAKATAAGELAKIKSLFRDLEFANWVTVETRLKQALRVLEEMEKNHPKAKELHEARLHCVVAASILAKQNKDAAMAGKVDAIAGRVASSDAPAELKAAADAHATVLKLQPVAATTSLPADHAAKLIREYVKRHEKGQAAPAALLMGSQMAGIVRNFDLAHELEQALIRAHPDSLQARQLTRWRGKPFQAALIKLDRTRLKLPDDLLGKVVVIDFWASWCQPCIAEIPNLKGLYAKYKPKGVEFVGISIDQKQADLEAFLKTQKLEWVQTYSGMFWEDPTARRYGVDSIPRMWVVGKDGKVFTDDAWGKVDWAIEKALKAPTTRPAGDPPVKPAK